jgi:hypothetical protein
MRLTRKARALASGAFLAVLVVLPTAHAAPPNSWRFGPSMNVGRDFQATGTLPDGPILMAGGQVSSGLEDSAEIFSPAANVWTPIHAMNEQRQAALAVTLASGKVLVGSGTTAEVYDPATNTWTPTATDMRDPRGGGLPVTGQFEITRLTSGKVLLAGGNGPTVHADLYDPADNKFHDAADMGTARVDPGQALLPDGRVLVAGGDAAGTSGEVYDPGSNTWTPVANQMASPHLADPLVAGGTGGAGPQPTTQIYSPMSVPAAPAPVSAVAGHGTATVSWAAPSSGGGRPILHYTVTASTGAHIMTPDTGTSLTVPGLANGVPVTFTVTATNELGTGPASAPSAAVTPTAPSVPDTTAPTVKVTGLNSKLRLQAFLKAVSATLTPSEPSSLTVDLLASATRVSLAKSYNLVLATKSYGLGGARKLKLKPSKKLVGKAKKFTVRLRVVATDAAGNRRTVTKTIKISG